MALSEAIKKEIERLSSHNEQNAIATYLRPKLESGEVSPQDLYEYAKNCCWIKKTGKTYAIDAGTLNRLGIIVSGLQDDSKKPLALQFFLLAAERNSSWGCRNYAECALFGKYREKSPETALEYAKKAVELSQNTSKPHQHKYIYAQTLKANNQYPSALTVSTEYLSWVITRDKESNIEKAVGICSELIDELSAIFQAGNLDYGLSEEHFQEQLRALKSIIYSINHDELLAIKNKACFLAGNYYEHLNKDSEAWLTYCQAKDKDSPFYEEVIVARKELLKRFIQKQLNEISVSALPIENLALEGGNPPIATKKELKNVLLLPNEIPFSFNFAAFWDKEAPWFHSVDEAALKKQYQKRCKQIEILIDAKKEEITLLGKAIRKELSSSDALEAKKTRVKNELEQLQKIKEEIESQYEQHLAHSRETLRRHKAETHFFDPKHLKKPEVLEKLRELTLAIIEQRFSLDNTLPALTLSGISSRMLITAERVFQEAVIALSGESGVALGIPRVRRRDWNIDGYSGTNWYGQIERYQVATTTIKAEHRTSPQRQRLGDSFMPQQHGTYSNDIYPFLKKLAANNPDNKKEIARYLIRYSRTHQAVTLDELQSFYPDANENDVNHFNRIAFLFMEKEQVQWHSATDKGYQLGMSVAQARTLRMLEAGYLSLEDVFKDNVIFGIYSHTKILNFPQKVAEACQRIDELYTSFLLNQNPEESMRFFKAQVKEGIKKTPVLTRKQAREDLRYVYGGNTDSDGEGYDSDLGL